MTRLTTEDLTAGAELKRARANLTDFRASPKSALASQGTAYCRKRSPTTLQARQADAR